MKALVIGGSGFLGGHIVQECCKRQMAVTIIDLAKPVYYNVSEFLRVDVTKPICINRESPQFDYIFNAMGELGSHTTFERIKSTFDVNLTGMINIMEWVNSLCYEPRIINCGLIRDWLNPYMISKHAASKIGQMYREYSGVKFLDCRMTVVYGQRQGWKEEKVVPAFILHALREERLPIYGDGSSLMNMMYVKDVAKLLVDTIGVDDLFGVKSPAVMDVANPDGDISVLEFAKAVVSAIDPHATVSNWIEYRDMRPGQPGNVGVKYDLDSAYKYIPDFSSSFRSLSVGLDQTINWYRGQL